MCKFIHKTTDTEGFLYVYNLTETILKYIGRQWPIVRFKLVGFAIISKIKNDRKVDNCTATVIQNPI